MYISIFRIGALLTLAAIFIIETMKTRERNVVKISSGQLCQMDVNSVLLEQEGYPIRYSSCKLLQLREREWFITISTKL